MLKSSPILALTVCAGLLLSACTDEPVGSSGVTAGPGGGATSSTQGSGATGAGGSMGGAGGAGGNEPVYSPCPTDAPCRIMPIGASITDGYNVPGGYRIHLWALAAGASKSIDFVGSLSNGPVELPDKEHEGHSGWKIEEVDAITVDRMTTYLPHILLVHVGTNDVRDGDDVTLIANRLRALVDTMTSTDPAVVVVLASLAPLADATDQLAVDALNAEVPTIVQDNQTANEHVLFADIAAALTAADLEDGIHPTAAGYDKMGTVWFDTIASMLP